MKTIITLFVAFSISLYSSAQVLCIKCYNQNARVLTDTNNLILNGGFENGCAAGGYFCPNSSSYNCNIANWVSTGGGGSTYAHIVDTSFSIIIEGSKAPYFGNDFSNVCSATLSDTSCISNNGCETIGIPVGYPYNSASYGGTQGIGLEQTVNGLTPSAVYLLEFWVGGEAYSPFSINQKGIFGIDLGFGNIFLRDPPTKKVIGIGTRYVIAFMATSSSHTVKFTNWGHIGLTSSSVCTELVLDDVRLVKSTESNPCITSIEDLAKNAVNVFPNPATTQLTITTNTQTPSEIILYDIASRKLMEEKFIKEVSLSIAHLAKGVYLYQVIDARGMVSRGKVVKE